MAQQTLLVLGASGDLAARLLLPGLGGLLASGGAEGLALLGAGASDWDDEQVRKRVADSFAAARAEGPAVDAVARETRYIKADVTDAGEMHRLLDACEGRPIVYFAPPPAVTERACRALC